MNFKDISLVLECTWWFNRGNVSSCNCGYRSRSLVKNHKITHCKTSLNLNCVCNMYSVQCTSSRSNQNWVLSKHSCHSLLYSYTTVIFSSKKYESLHYLLLVSLQTLNAKTFTLICKAVAGHKKRVAKRLFWKYFSFLTSLCLEFCLHGSLSTEFSKKIARPVTVVGNKSSQLPCSQTKLSDGEFYQPRSFSQGQWLLTGLLIGCGKKSQISRDF